MILKKYRYAAICKIAKTNLLNLFDGVINDFIMTMF